MMDIFRTNGNANIEFDRIEQRQVTKVSRDRSKSSSVRISVDYLTLSESAKEFEELKGILENIPEIRQEKVTALKEKIRQGEYQVDSDKVAEEILMAEINLTRYL